jgi:hypothetical protein
VGRWLAVAGAVVAIALAGCGGDGDPEWYLDSLDRAFNRCPDGGAVALPVEGHVLATKVYVYCRAVRRGWFVYPEPDR